LNTIQFSSLAIRLESKYIAALMLPARFLKGASQTTFLFALNHSLPRYISFGPSKTQDQA
jgi:hypothetical protein